MTHSNRTYFGLVSGIGLVIANMVGAGVFLSTGFMAQDLGPKLIMLSWLVGLFIALSGAIAYARLAFLSGHSGGEYRLLHDNLHPYIGYLAGWASLLIGFSAPIAIDAFAVGAFMRQVGIDIPVKTTGTIVIILLTLAHALRLYWSKYMQNLLVALKLSFVLFFIIFGISIGSNAWPQWQPPNLQTEFPTAAFFQNQYWVAYAFSGWNAAVYIASEYANPQKDVSRAIVIGCCLVGALYLAINWVFIANLTPDQAIIITHNEESRITLAHLVIDKLVGKEGAMFVSSVAVLVFLSALSALTLVGSRVYSEMAKDGLLPKLFCSQPGKPPLYGLLIQCTLALTLLHTQALLDIVKSTVAVIMVFSMLTVSTLFSAKNNTGPKRQAILPLVAAAIYVVSTFIILSSGFYSSKAIGSVLSIIFIVGTGGYLFVNKTCTR